MNDPRLTAEVMAHPYPLLFATLSGAHLYGFPSPDSDFDLRGIHVLPLEKCLGLDRPDETVALAHVREGVEVDLVTHDVRKFFSLLLQNNGYVLEQLYSPLVVWTGPFHDELQQIARGCITRRCRRHYLGFALSQWGIFARQERKRVKTLLYVYRVLLTGIHMMRTGEVNANLLECNAEMKLPYLADLVACKVEGKEKDALSDPDFIFHQSEVERLRGVLEEASTASHLPEAPLVRDELNGLLLRIRKEQAGSLP